MESIQLYNIIDYTRLNSPHGLDTVVKSDRIISICYCNVNYLLNAARLHMCAFDYSIIIILKIILQNLSVECKNYTSRVHRPSSRLFLSGFKHLFFPCV